MKYILCRTGNALVGVWSLAVQLGGFVLYSFDGYALHWTLVLCVLYSFDLDGVA